MAVASGGGDQLVTETDSYCTTDYLLNFHNPLRSRHGVIFFSSFARQFLLNPCDYIVLYPSMFMKITVQYDIIVHV